MRKTFTLSVLFTKDLRVGARQLLFLFLPSLNNLRFFFGIEIHSECFQARQVLFLCSEWMLFSKTKKRIPVAFITKLPRLAMPLCCQQSSVTPGVYLWTSDSLPRLSGLGELFDSLISATAITLLKATIDLK